MAKLLDLIPAIESGKSVTCTTARMTQVTISAEGDRFVLQHYLLEGEWAKPQYFSLEELKSYAAKGISDSWQEA